MELYIETGLLLLGVVIIGIGIAVLVALKDLQEILPVNVIPISLIVLGVVVFIVGFLACCGAIRESRCMLICYSIIVGLLLAGFIYLSVVIFGQLSTIEETVDGWIATAFNNNDLRPVFNVMEVAFRCCGTTGVASYIAANQTIPFSCCSNPVNDTCAAADTFRGCGSMVGGWFETFSGVIGGVLLVIIIVQSVAVVFAVFLSHSIANKKRRSVY